MNHFGAEFCSVVEVFKCSPALTAHAEQVDAQLDVVGRGEGGSEKGHSGKVTSGHLEYLSFFEKIEDLSINVGELLRSEVTVPTLIDRDHFRV